MTMRVSAAPWPSLQSLEEHMRLLLPTDLHDRLDAVSPRAMGSAALQFDEEGRVAWDRIWRGFCDLALAGGPPHKGRLLEPFDVTDRAQPGLELERLQAELGRGLRLAAGVTAEPSPSRGYMRLYGLDRTLAAWLLRAIAIENVAVFQAESGTLDVPCAVPFRIDKEIKNVVTVVAKATHYWHGHMPPQQQAAIAAHLEALEKSFPLIQPSNAGWSRVECASVDEAIWQARAMIAMNHLARREDTTLLFAAVTGEDAAPRLRHVQALWAQRSAARTSPLL